MSNRLAIAMAVLMFTCGPAVGAGMSKEDYRDAKKRITSEYLAERQKCGAGYGHAYELCVAHAHGVRDVAKAELEAAYKPSPRNYYDAAIARAKSTATKCWSFWKKRTTRPLMCLSNRRRLKGF